ncbi:MAG: hypothetical protein GX778_05150 [Erysipelothrix sp.]|nr:hypothetical protein [Erysipelothrix sp.]
MMNVKYVGKSTKDLDHGSIHALQGNLTSCGKRIDENRNDWKMTTQHVTCDRKGCKKK